MAHNFDDFYEVQELIDLKVKIDLTLRGETLYTATDFGKNTIRSEFALALEL